MSKIKKKPTLDIIFYKQPKNPKVQEKPWHYVKIQVINSKYSRPSNEETI